MALITKTCKPCGTGTFCWAIRKGEEVIASWFSGSAVPSGNELFWTNKPGLSLETCRILSEEALQNSSLAD